MMRATLAAAAVVVLLAGCDGRVSAETKSKPDISQRVRVENLPIRIERTQKLSDSESVKVIIVPGYPYGQRCVVYASSASSAMHCEEISASQQ